MKLSKTMLFAVLAGLPAMAQQAAPADRVQGAIVGVNVQARQIAVKTDKGDPVTIVTSDRTVLLRMPAGVTDPKQGVKIELSGITADDKLVAIGKLSADKKNLEGLKIYVLTKSDIAQIHQNEDDDWQKRGASGVVTAIDAAAKSFTLKAGSKEITVESSDKTDFHRYSEDSFKSTDAKTSSLGEIKVEDQVRVLGNKNAGDDKIAAERIFFGTFRHISATIDSIDAQSGEIKVKDLATKKLLQIRLDPDSKLKKLAPEMAAMLARRFNPGASQSGDGGGRGAGRGGYGGGSGGGRGRGGDIGQVFDRAPAVTLAELKRGDAVVVLTTAGSTPGRVTAVMLVAGVEDLLTSPNAARDVMNGWNLGGGGGGGGEGN